MHAAPHTTIRKTLTEKEWVQKKLAHQRVLEPILLPYLEARSRQEKNPVLDFLFEYYNFRPARLMRWSPGFGVALQFSDPDELPEFAELCTEQNHAFLDPTGFPQKRVGALRWTLELLKSTHQKKPMAACFGMHEWAMVYKSRDVRHGQIPLRLPDDEIAAFVESRPLLCTHFDAFRFFTEPAKPLNKNSLCRSTFMENEQPGCLHTNMDLYKWAYKLYPWISGELLRDAFLHAVEIRKVDMQASPYDAREFGLEPIKIETEEGRREYLRRQAEIFENSQPIRERLIGEYEGLVLSLES